MEGLKINNLRVLGRPPMSIYFEPSTCTCLSGSSGIGKTVFLRAVADLDMHGGEVLLDGIDCSRMKAPDWRKTVALIPAESQWWCDTVGEHFVNYNENWLEKLGLSGRVMKQPVAELSTGERQRLALVRTLSNYPRVLLLDEPTGSLDIDNVLQVELLVKEYQSQNKAIVIWVSHDPVQIDRISHRHLIFKRDGLVEKETG